MAERHVVVAHGLWMPGIETGLLRRRLRAAGFTTHLFRFRSVGSGLDQNAAELARLLARLPGERVDLVGHSLGGVVAVYMVQQLQPPQSGRVVCLGSPLNGSRAGRALAALPGGRRLLGRSVLDLNARGGLAPWPAGRELGIVAGRLPYGLGRILGVLPKPNDGIVAVDETRLAGATDHLVAPATHTMMLLSRFVAGQIVHFLRHGRFERVDTDA